MEYDRRAERVIIVTLICIFCVEVVVLELYLVVDVALSSFWQVVAVSSSVNISCEVASTAVRYRWYAAVVGGRFLGKGEKVVLYIVCSIYYDFYKAQSHCRVEWWICS